MQKISTILKATAIKSFSRKKVAKLSGTDWQSFLASTFSSGENYKNTFTLLDFQYTSETEQNKISASEINILIDVSVKWVRSHRV